MALRLIHLEDDPNDRALVADVLRANGIVCTVVAAASREAFEAALAEPPDLILADVNLPGFDGIAAQHIAAERWPDVPFVFVSGSIGEEFAVERLKSGATDYVLKQHLDKLPTAVRRAIRETDDRQQRARAEFDLQQLNAELQARVEDRTRALQKANELLDSARREADRANLAKSDFLSRMSHDLRTPLNAILGFAQMLQLDPLTNEQADSVSQIMRGGRHLLQLINEVLEIARIETGRLSVSPEPVPVAHAVRHAIELIQPLAAPRGITVRIGEMPDLNALADRQRLTQILLNLLSNAVKYNRASGCVDVSAREADGRVVIAVADTGAGIPAAKLGLLFIPFERLGAEASGIEGTGLGLAASKALAEAMNGTLTAESHVDVGTTFSLGLPACSPAAPRQEAAWHVPEQPADVTGLLLYVEDNVPNVTLMRKLLARRPGVELVVAETGEAALRAVEERRPDLVFLDLHLPDMTGDDVLHRLFENPATRTIPVAVLSADATLSGQRRVLASGARVFLTKPLDVAEVLRLVDDVLVTERNRRS